MINIKNLTFSYDESEILNNFNLTVNNGECVQLFGISGSGKTTVMRLILGLEKPQDGEIAAPKNISVVFQEDRLLENVDVQSNIRLVISKDQYSFADTLLREFGLYDFRKKRVSELSGGMKRRVALIRAIAYNGDALILDEPFNGLDYDNKIIAAKIIKKEFIQKNKPVLLITHVSEDADLLGAKTINL